MYFLLLQGWCFFVVKNQEDISNIKIMYTLVKNTCLNFDLPAS